MSRKKGQFVFLDQDFVLLNEILNKKYNIIVIDDHDLSFGKFDFCFKISSVIETYFITEYKFSEKISFEYYNLGVLKRIESENSYAIKFNVRNHGNTICVYADCNFIEIRRCEFFRKSVEFIKFTNDVFQKMKYISDRNLDGIYIGKHTAARYPHFMTARINPLMGAHSEVYACEDS